MTFSQTLARSWRLYVVKMTRKMDENVVDPTTQLIDRLEADGLVERAQ